MKKIKGMCYADYVPATKDRPSIYKAYLDLYELNVWVIIGQEKKVQAMFPKTEGHFSRAFCFANSNGEPIIWLQEKGMIDDFAHEVIHAIGHILKSTGVEYDADNDEPIAYLMSWYMRVFYFSIKDTNQ
jgi:galactose-1-phosphate uridylyltransferase